MTDLKDDMIDVSVIIKKLLYPFKLLTSHYKTTVSFIIASTGIAIILYFVIPPIYSASFIIKPNERKDSYYVNMLMDLATLAKDKDFKGIANELKVTETDAEFLKKISVNIINKSKGADSGEAAIITLQMKECVKFIAIQKGILNYLETNRHYQKLKKNRLENIKKLEYKLRQEIIEIDSVKRIVINNITPPQNFRGSGLFYNVPLDPFRAYDVNMQRYKEQLNLLILQDFSNSFDLIKPCVVSSKPVFPKLSWLLLFAIPASLIACIFFLHFKAEKQSSL